MERPRPLAAIHDHGGSRTLEVGIPDPKSLTSPSAAAARWPSNGPQACKTHHQNTPLARCRLAAQAKLQPRLCSRARGSSPRLKQAASPGLATGRARLAGRSSSASLLPGGSSVGRHHPLRRRRPGQGSTPRPGPDRCWACSWTLRPPERGALAWPSSPRPAWTRQSTASVATRPAPSALCWQIIAARAGPGPVLLPGPL